MWQNSRLAWLSLVVLSLLVSGCSSGSSAAASQHNPPPSSDKTDGQAAITAASSDSLNAPLVIKPWSKLPVKIIGSALAADGNGGIYSVGGYTGKHSIGQIYQLGSSEAAVSAKLPVLMHDEAAGWIGNMLYIVGGGQSSSYDTIYRMDENRKVKLVGHFPTPISDVNAVPYAAAGNPGLMIIGGYDGKNYNMKMRLMEPKGQSVRLTSSSPLPAGLRYGAITTDGADIFIAGGKTASGLSDKVYVWSGKQRIWRVLAVLPGAREKAAAFVFHHRLLVIGGLDGKGNVLSQIVNVNTETGKTEVEKQPFPTPVADMGYTQDKDAGYLAGGQISGQQYASTVYKITY